MVNLLYIAELNSLSCTVSESVYTEAMYTFWWTK